jgi:hypothetical protein
MLNQLKCLAAASMILALFIVTGCASAPATGEDAVKQRAEQRWEAIFAKEYASAYEFYSPGYRSKYSATDLEIALRVQKVRWFSADYVDHSCEEKSCIVRFNLGYKVAAPVPGIDVWTGWDTIEEQWIQTGGEWWYLPTKQ